MTPDEYWHGSPELTRAYLEAEKLRKEDQNRGFWLQGLYFYHALMTCVSKALDKNSKAEYMSEPLRIFPPTKEEIEEDRREEAERLEAQLNAFARAFNGE